MLRVDIASKVAAFEVACGFDVTRGETLALIGESGAGKTTVLRSLAGLLRPLRGHITCGATSWFDAEQNFCLPAQRRDCAMVFARYALFGHLSVSENVAFGLRASGHGKRAIAKTTAATLDLIGIGELAHRKAASLSSGEAQRAAIARALAVAPAVLLLDEPLSAIDVERRSPVREALQRAIRETGMAVVLVTHDPAEAMLFSETLVILERGEVVQRGSPAELRERPRSRYVAAFAGVNLFRGVAQAQGGGVSSVEVDGSVLTIAGQWTGPVALVLDPDDVVLSRTRPESSARNCLAGPVAHALPDGNGLRVTVGSHPSIVARITQQSGIDLGIAAGVPVFASFKASEMRVH